MPEAGAKSQTTISGPTIIFGLLIGGTLSFQLLTLIYAPVTREAIRRFHLTSDSKILWAMTQFVPSMYNFENKITFNEHGAQHSFYINHYPTRTITTGGGRQYLRESKEAHITLNTKYQDIEVETVYEVTAQRGDNGPFLIKVRRLTP